MTSPRLPLLLTLEAWFSGIYLSMTRGFLLIYLVALGFGLHQLSLTTAAYSAAAMASALTLYKGFTRPRGGFRKRLITLHAAERLAWLAIPFVRDLAAAAAVLSIVFSLASQTGAMVNTLLLGTFADEASFRKITSARSMAFNASTIVGYLLGITLLQTPQPYVKLYFTGVASGLVSTTILSLADFEEPNVGEAGEEPAELFTSALYLFLLLSSANLLMITWFPLLKHGGAGDSDLGVLNLVVTATSMAATLLWSRTPIRRLRHAASMGALTPLLILISGPPPAGLVPGVYWGAFFTGGNFLGAVLFSRYMRLLGPWRSGALLTTVFYASNMFSGLLGIASQGSHVTALLLQATLYVAALAVAALAIPPVAAVTPGAARNYAITLYRNGLLGYKVTVEVSTAVITGTLRLLALTLATLTLYLIYRILFLIIP